MEGPLGTATALLPLVRWGKAFLAEHGRKPLPGDYPEELRPLLALLNQEKSRRTVNGAAQPLAPGDKTQGAQALLKGQGGSQRRLAARWRGAIRKAHGVAAA